MIESLQLGIKISKLIIDILLYADDIILVSNSLINMKKMLKVVEQFGNSHEIKFNPLKSELLIINRKRKREFNQYKLTLNGAVINETKSIKYLGNYISSNLKNTTHLIQRRKLAFISKTKLTPVGFDNKQLNIETKSTMYKTYVRSNLLYGLENTVLNNKEINEMQCFESGIIKRAIGFNNKVGSTSILNAFKIDRFKTRLALMKCNFMLRLLNNSYTREIVNNVITIYKNNANKLSIIFETAKNMNLRYINVNTLEDKCRKTIKIIKERSKEIFNSKEAQVVRYLVNERRRDELFELVRKF